MPWSETRGRFPPRIRTARVVWLVAKPNTGKAANAVVVLGELLELSDEHLDAVLEHEIGHLVMKHSVPGAVTLEQTYYEAGAEEPLGILAPKDDAVRAKLVAFYGDMQEAGPYAIPELRDLPAGSGSLAMYHHHGAGGRGRG